MQSRPLLKIITCMIAVTCLQGCLAGAVVVIAAETIEAGVEITGAAVGGVVDIVTLNDDEEEDGGAFPASFRKAASLLSWMSRRTCGLQKDESVTARTTGDEDEENEADEDDEDGG